MAQGAEREEQSGKSRAHGAESKAPSAKDCVLKFLRYALSAMRSAHRCIAEHEGYEFLQVKMMEVKDVSKEIKGKN